MNKRQIKNGGKISLSIQDKPAAYRVLYSNKIKGGQYELETTINEAGDTAIVYTFSMPQTQQITDGSREERVQSQYEHEVGSMIPPHSQKGDRSYVNRDKPPSDTD